MENKFEWSDSGLQLLSEINIRIESYGGRGQLLKIIELEQAMFVKKPVNYFITIKKQRFAKRNTVIRKSFTEKELRFIIHNHKRLTYKKIAVKLKRTDSSVFHKIQRMLDAGILNYKAF